MEKEKRHSARVYLHDAYEEWTRQRDLFLRSRPQSFWGRFDEEFASHLLQHHAHAQCICKRASDRTRSMPVIPGFLPDEQPPLPRLTPIKDKVRPTTTSCDKEVYRTQGSASADETSSLILCHQDDGRQSDIPGQPSTTCSSHANAKSRRQSAHCDHTYTRDTRSSTLSADLDSASMSKSLPESVARSLPTPEKIIFDPASASTPHGKTSSVQQKDSSTSTRRGLFGPSSSEEPDRDPVDTESSDSDEDLSADAIPDFTSHRHDMPLNTDDSRTGLDLEIFDIDLGAQETVSDDKGEGDSVDEDNDEKLLVQQKKCIIFEDKLLELLIKIHGTHCVRCESRYSYRTVQRGTAIVVTWECPQGHKDSWTSQPRYNGMFAGNLHTVSAIVMSGSSFQKVATMSHFLNLRMMSRTTFQQIQKLYVSPAVTQFYKEKQEELLSTYNKPVVLSGDGRSDSPGYSATFCTYSLCDESSKKILHTTTVMVQEACGKSPNMERIGFERALDFITRKLDVEAIVTDAHPQIGALMKRSEKYSGIKHQWDVWHGSKNFVKKVSAASQQKNCQDLQPWVRKLSNHFWYSAQTCNGDSNELAGNLAGMLHHIVNEHEWLFTLDGRPGSCQHAPLEDHQTAWLQKGSPSHEKLRSIIMDKRFMKTLHYYEDFRHTGSLELFHSTLLMYASKRSFFTLPGYCLRVHLAVLDANFHSDRKQALTKDGEPRWRKKWNKRTKRFTITPVKEPKTYDYIPELIVRVFKQRKVTPGPMSQHVSMAEDDPRRVHPTIAMIPSVPTAQLVAEHQSRFARN